jgi:hypothetical protein
MKVHQEKVRILENRKEMVMVEIVEIVKMMEMVEIVEMKANVTDLRQEST